jgi:hypothetical protein
MARRAPLWVAAVLVGLAVSCSHDGAPTVSATTAAQTVAAVYKLDASQEQCLARGFAHHSAATRPLASNRAARDDDLNALGAVAQACIPVSTLAGAIVGGVGQGGSLSSAEQNCLRTAVAHLDATDRATLLSHLAVPTALSDLQTALLGRVTDGLLNTCHVSIPGVTTQDTAGAG